MRLLKCFPMGFHRRKSHKCHENFRSQLPNESLLEVLKALDRDSLDSCVFTCRRYREIVDGNGDMLALRLMDRLELVSGKCWESLATGSPSLASFQRCIHHESERSAA